MKKRGHIKRGSRYFTHLSGAFSGTVGLQSPVYLRGSHIARGAWNSRLQTKTQKKIWNGDGRGQYVATWSMAFAGTVQGKVAGSAGMRQGPCGSRASLSHGILNTKPASVDTQSAGLAHRNRKNRVVRVKVRGPVPKKI